MAEPKAMSLAAVVKQIVAQIGGYPGDHWVEVLERDGRSAGWSDAG